MNELVIEYLDIGKLMPYMNNPRVNDEAVDKVANSIKEFGFKNPIVIDKNNVIVAGHTRLKASRLIGLEKVPCIRADDLTEEQVKAFRIADNAAGELSAWDFGKLQIELADIDIDMGSFGLDIGSFDINLGSFEGFSDDDSTDDSVSGDDGGWYGDERERTNNAYNLGIIDHGKLTHDFWQMPIIRNDNFIPNDLIGFNYAKTSRNKAVGIHFYIDDYQFERIWNDPEKYIDALLEYDCILSPDFSLYMDMPMPMKIWNVYRSRQIGAFYQSKGIKVIPTVSWAEKDTFGFCFQGIPEGSIVSISTIGVKGNEQALNVWRDGVTAMIDRIKPSAILVYGGKLEYDYGSIETFHFDNKVTTNWKKGV